MKAIILAGGFGTRLKTVTGEDVPKPMVSIAGKPFLEHQILFLKDQGVTEIILAVHHHADKIKSYFGDGRIWYVDITYSEEDFPLGTAGAVKKAEKYIDDTFIVLNGDSYSHVDLKKLVEFHKSKRSIGTLALKESNELEHYGNVSVEGEKVISFEEKKESGNSNTLMNSGVYVFEPKIFDYIESDKNVSLEKEVFPRLVERNILWSYKYEGYFMDIGRPETYNQFKKDVVKTLYMSPARTVRDALYKIDRSRINLILIVNEQDKLLGVINERLAKEYLLKGGKVDDLLESAMIRDPVTASVHDSEEKISGLLQSGIWRLPILDDQGKVVDVAFRTEQAKTEIYPTLRGRTPLRISFAGGGTDLPDFFEKHGGVVINTTVDKYCYATITKRADSKIVINSDLGEEVVVDSRKDLHYDGKFNLIKAIVNILKPEFGFEIYLHNDIPPGRGLGSSASAAVLITSLLGELMNIKYGDQKIAEIAYKAETQELGIKGGWQDQYAAVTGGFSFMEFNKDKTIIYPLRLKEEVINELNHHMLLCYVGNAHQSVEQQDYLTDNLVKSEEEILNCLNTLKGITLDIKDSLLTNEIDNVGKLLHESWENKKKMSAKISDPKIDALYVLGMKNGALGGKLLGSGGGGYILFFYDPKKRNNLKKALEAAGGELVNFKFESEGTKIWGTQSKLY